MSDIIGNPSSQSFRRRAILRQALGARLSFVGVLVVLRIALDASYIFFVTPIFDYAGLSLQIDPVKVTESYIFFIILSLIVPCKLNKPSDFLVLLLFLFPIFATLSFYGLNDQNRNFTYMIIASFLLFITVRNAPRVKVTSLQGGRIIAVILAATFVTTALIIMAANGGFKQMTFQLGNELYQFREATSEQVRPGFVAYLFTWVFKLFNMALLVWGLYRRKFLVVVVVLALQVLFFATSHAKAVLFFPVIIFGIYFSFRNRLRMHIIIFGLIGVISASLLVSYLTDSILLPSLFIRRIFYLPVQMNYAYYEFFSQNGLVYMSNSVLSFLNEYPYSYNPPNLIGDFIYGTPKTNANTGFLATGYMHFGFVGMLLFSAITGFLVRMVDSLVVDRLPNWVGLAIIIVPFWSLFLSSDLSTAMLTHGIIPGFVMLWLFGSYHRSIRQLLLRLRMGSQISTESSGSPVT